jgi:hypothetical protein
MKTVTGVFASQTSAKRAAKKLRSIGLAPDEIAVLVSGEIEEKSEPVPISTAEQPGMGTVMGSVVGAAAGIAGGWGLGAATAAVIPGVGPVVAIGLWGAALLGLAGAGTGALVGKALEDATTEGLPEDEVFVYEDALRRGHSVVIALPDYDDDASAIREIFKAEGAETVDAARDQWWIGLRSAEKEHYSKLGKSFEPDEKIYRMGYEAALHARTRGKAYDQVASEMAADLEYLRRRYPGSDVDEPFRRGYERGRAYYESLRNGARHRAA